MILKNPQLLNAAFKQIAHRNKAALLSDPITYELVGQLQLL